MLNVQGTEDCANRSGPCSQINHLKSGILRACRKAGFDRRAVICGAAPKSPATSFGRHLTMTSFALGYLLSIAGQRGEIKEGLRITGLGFGV